MQDLGSPFQTDASPFDLAHLERATFGDRAFRNEVLMLFTSESKTLLERLATAKSDADWRVAAHTLKGMARGVGANPLAAAAAAAEPLTNGHRLERRGEMLARLSRIAAEATAEADRLMGAN